MRKNLMRDALLVIGFLLASGATANAMALYHLWPVPEIDPSLAVGAVALLAGSIAVLRAQRR